MRCRRSSHNGALPAGPRKSRLTVCCGRTITACPANTKTKTGMNTDTTTILAIDNGTQSVRALLFDLAGNIVATSQVMLDPYFSTQPGWAEHDPEDYWQSLCRACQGLWTQPGVRRESVAGVAVTR